MAGRIATGSHIAGAALVVMALLSPFQLPAENRVKKPLPEKTSGNVYDMKRLLRNLETTKSKPSRLNQPIMIYNIRNGQLGFQPTPDDLARLRKAGATAELIEAIVEKAGLNAPTEAPAVPPDPPKRKAGRLTVTCKPLDCQVFIGEDRIGTTTGGELRDHVLPEGQVSVSAKLQDHIPDKQEQVIEILDDASAQVDFAFTVDPDALSARGQSLFDAMIKALGGDLALQESASFRATGSLDVFTGTGVAAQWPFAALIRLPGKARIETNKRSRKYVVVKTDSGFSWKPAQRDKESEDLEAGVRNLMGSHISEIVGMLRGPGMRVKAEKLDSDPGRETIIRVEKEAYTYRIALNSESVPTEILLESGGLNAGLKLLLSDYVRKGGALIPMRTEVLLPGSHARGFIVRYETMELNPQGVTDQKFDAKKGLSFWSR